MSKLFGKGELDAGKIVENLIKLTDNDQQQWTLWGCEEALWGWITKDRDPHITLTKKRIFKPMILEIYGEKITKDKKLLSRLKNAIVNQDNRHFKGWVEKDNEKVRRAVKELENA